MKLDISLAELARRVSQRFGKRVPWQSIQQFEVSDVKNPAFFLELCTELGVSPEYIRLGDEATGRSVQEGRPEYLTQRQRALLAAVESANLSDVDSDLVARLVRRLATQAIEGVNDG